MTPEALEKIKQEARKVAEGSPLFFINSSPPEQKVLVDRITEDLLEGVEQEEEVSNA